MPPSAPASSPVVTVVVPCHQSATYVGETLASAFAQTYAALEVVVVDDGSRDALGDALAPYRDRIRFLAHEHRGIARTRNRAIDESAGPLIALLDADDLWEPEKIAAQVAFLEAHPECGLVHTDRALIGPDGARVRQRALMRPRPAEGDCRHELVRQTSIVPSSVLLRRSVLGTLRFDPETEPADDWALWIRLACRTRVGYLEDRLTRYRIHAANASNDSARLVHAGIAVMNGVLAMPEADAEMRRLASDRLGALSAQAGHLAFERGDFPAARRWFGAARGHLGRGGRRRYALSFLPPWVMGMVRRKPARVLRK